MGKENQPMPATAKAKLEVLKTLYGDYQLTDDDYYEDLTPDISIDAMFAYFRGQLGEDGEVMVLERARASKLFLHDLINVGEMETHEGGFEPAD